jgi:cellulose synthase/poly-beta-1,6-N-acetylglucosamine synthase-like glycosyltransferase
VTALSITVVIPTRDRGELIRETLQRVMALRHPAMEVVVADQSIGEDTCRAVREVSRDDHRVRIERTSTAGSGVNRNVGLAASCSDLVAYIDDDCIVDEGWLDAIVREFSDHPEVDAVFGRMLPYGQSGRTGVETGFKPDLQRREFTCMTPPWWVGHGGNMAFRRSALLEVGGFDPVLGAGAPLRSGEDADITYRLLRRGRRLVYTPDALAYHKQWKDWRDQRSMERAYGIGVGAQFAKYVRCGDLPGARMLATWIWQLGVRRIGAGLLKWRSRKVMYLGYCQLVYPLVGIASSLRYRIDRERIVYRPG